MGAAHEEPRCPFAGALPARNLDRRLPGSADGLARQGRAQSFACRDRAVEGRVGGRIQALAKARSVGSALCLCLGRRRLSASADGAASRMHVGAHRRDAGGQEGVARLSDGHAGERAELERIARRFEGARPFDRSRNRYRRRRAWVLEGSRRNIPVDASSALLATQNAEHPRQAAEVPAIQRAR